MGDTVLYLVGACFMGWGFGWVLGALFRGVEKILTDPMP